ncbi:tRNA preQ1(34) S-adenosylmethionine ribosyltransferase-isomerase QueA [Limnohabitans sp. Rim8]|jgi:S-adenosylmethionine:tRNA ribosyltransferase-isomerase|uniref:tRNA preQ1(34) S-adenosylmethionine ribosyltransferase-isomerase QueA n=1 Tax=Limnohabitans sp. Rim8 TaxID=1100718 RepID=UPI000D386329|nr:tRNA preQ1(34) S-adenosylmethionine ribosyltransferase-isomerase QueA [Limnohabitans sp. Rim8]PUE54879.1 tRNA preQ1(34) S-adenosylmethionine ribosyltransferase-isomerase QueA [Limnohabitans sp. Rim8]
MSHTYTLSDFDFELPESLIAQHPASERSASRLLDGRHAEFANRTFKDLPSLLKAGDLLVFNDTQVVKARLFGEKPTGGKLELLVERVLTNHEVVAHMKVSKKPPVGTELLMVGGKNNGGFNATLLGRWPNEDGQLFRFKFSDEPHTLMQRHGHMPLPPYIERHQNTTDAQHETEADKAEDERRYQTVFAKHPGAAAAPTAALHFDEGVLQGLEAQGVARASVTLHVGAGTFQPVKTENLAEHRMHSEWYNIPPETVQAIADCRARGGRVVAVGTTSVRTLESWAQSGQASGDTQIFITPGFAFQVVDVLITNFHLPKSTLLMLVSAFAGFEHMHALYRHAIANHYRFFSYGDAMLLERNSERKAAHVEV